MKGFSKTQYPNLIRNDKSGIYYARARVGNNSRKAKSLETDVLSIAKLKLPRVLAQIRASAGRLKGGNLTLGECAAVYLDNLKTTPRKGKLPKPEALEYRASTLEGIRKLLPDFDRTRASAFTPELAQAWQRRALKKSGSWFNGMLQTFRAVMQVAVDAGSIEVNPFSGIGQVQVINKPGIVYSFAQMEVLFAELHRRKMEAEAEGRNSHAWYLCRFLYHFSLRLDTATALKPAMADRNALQFIIPGELVKGERAGSIIRVPIFSEMAKLLDELDTEFEKDREFILPIKGCIKVLAAACAAINLPRLRHHDFRHIFTTHAILTGEVDVPTLARWLNHHDGGALLLKRYNHIFDKVSQDKAAKLKFRIEPDEKITAMPDASADSSAAR